MKKFKFRLQRVLEYRNVLKKNQQQELAVQQHNLFSAEAEVERIRIAHDNSPQVSGDLMSMAELALAGEYQGALQEALVNQRLMVMEAVQAVDEAREVYVERAVEAEILESLRKKRHAEYEKEQRRTDRKELNDIAVRRHRFRKLQARGQDDE